MTDCIAQFGAVFQTERIRLTQRLSDCCILGRGPFIGPQENVFEKCDLVEFIYPQGGFGISALRDVGERERCQVASDKRYVGRQA